MCLFVCVNSKRKTRKVYSLPIFLEMNTKILSHFHMRFSIYVENFWLRSYKIFIMAKRVRRIINEFDEGHTNTLHRHKHRSITYHPPVQCRQIHHSQYFVVDHILCLPVALLQLDSSYYVSKGKRMKLNWKFSNSSNFGWTQKKISLNPQLFIGSGASIRSRA